MACSIGILSYSFTSNDKIFNEKSEEQKKSITTNNIGDRISFKVKGTGSKKITIKVGYGKKVGQGSCCRTIGPNTTTSFTANVGDVLYDSERKTIITKIYSGLSGKVIDLKNYY
jgi:hypothetical protein